MKYMFYVCIFAHVKANDYFCNLNLLSIHLYMKDRIMQIMQREGLTNAEFAEKIGISTSSLSHIFTGRNKASLEVVKNIHKACPYVNLNWLLYGEGEMESTAKPPVPTGFDLFSQPQPHATTAITSSVVVNDKKADSKPPVQEGIPTTVKESIKYIQTPPPKITEIRIFFDNGTYEVFKPGNK